MSSPPSARSSQNSSARMHYRPLGRTGLDVSVVGFGAAPLGDLFGRADPVEATRAVHFAIDEGINFFDVSPYYGLTLAEERLGAALEGKRAAVVLATKCGRYGDAEFDFSARRITRGLEDSLRRLRTDHVDLLQAHDIEFGDAQQIIAETIPAMRRLQQQGKARYIGISGYPLKVLLRVAAAVPLDSILSYCRYNLLCNDLDSVLMPFAREHGIGLINASALHMGILTTHGPQFWHPAPPQVVAAAQQALEFCRLQGVDLPQLALRFCLDYSPVATTLVGMSTTDLVRRNLHAFGSPADPHLLRQVRDILAPVHNHVWPSGRPENQDF